MGGLKNGISELVSGLPKVRQLVSGRIKVRAQLPLIFSLGASISRRDPLLIWAWVL